MVRMVNGTQRHVLRVKTIRAEPNGQTKVECMAEKNEHICPYDANLTQGAFFKLYDRAHQTLRKVAPQAKVVAPSLSDGGPGNFGFARARPAL